MTRQLPQELLQVVNNFMEEEYGEGAFYESVEEMPTDLPIAYTTTSSEKNEVLVSFDVEELKWKEYINGELVFVNKRETLEDFIDELAVCTFADVVRDILCEAEKREENENESHCK